METYAQLSPAEKCIARDNFGENVHNMLYDFKHMVAIEMDNDGNVVDIDNSNTIDDLPF